MKRKGNITRISLVTTLGVLVVVSGVYLAYNMWQNSHVKAGGLTTVGRTGASGITTAPDQFTWTSLGNVGANTAPVTTIAASACKLPAIDGNFTINLKGVVVAGDGTYKFVPVGNDKSGSGTYIYASDAGDQGTTTAVGNIDYLSNGYANNVFTNEKSYYKNDDKLQVYFGLRNDTSGVNTSSKDFTVGDLANCS